MLLTPRLYQQSQTHSGQELWSSIRNPFDASATGLRGWYELPHETQRHVQKMLLLHQTGSVRIGEIVRYTLTYTPSEDRIIPTPSNLFVKVRNTSAIALRAAYLHGPYTLYAACYPSIFDPNTKYESPDVYGHPQFEPYLKAGGSWSAQLKVPEDIRETALASDNRRHSARAGGSITWIIELTSQVLFSSSAMVHFELVVGRDEKSVDFGFAGMGGMASSVPGTLLGYQEAKRKGHGNVQTKGVYTRAIGLTMDDTESLWSMPPLPGLEHEKQRRGHLRSPEGLKETSMTTAVGSIDRQLDEPQAEQGVDNAGPSSSARKKRQKVHLVIITHGLHSNLGADMLYLKESIDAGAKQARLDRKMRKAKEKTEKATITWRETNKDTLAEADQSEHALNDNAHLEPHDEDEDEDNDEQVVVRGFSGNAVRTERGIQYLGKRLAKYVLSITYPDQPYIPVKKKSVGKSLSRALSGNKGSDLTPGHPTHGHSTIRREPLPDADLAYQFSGISFIGHSLGGLVQTYAIAYIQKHSPEFFELIKPINFVALASPFLGLSNENPLYVKFALDFGLVGRTGQDLGLTWRPPTVVRSGWGAMIAGIGTEGQRKHRQLDPGSKPLLRILPSGPAHQVLRSFRNRTLYSNVVNDGIVPLRTSCLLFLDWRGLGRVEKARRENGLVGTMAGWGWAELTGQNISEQYQRSRQEFDADHRSVEDNTGDDGTNTPTRHGEGDTVPQPSEDAVQDYSNTTGITSVPREDFKNVLDKHSPNDSGYDGNKSPATSAPSSPGASPFAGLLSMLRPGSNTKNPHSEPNVPRHTRIYKRSQTLNMNQDGASSDIPDSLDGQSSSSRPGMARGDSILAEANVFAPPKTSVFESAGDILNPPLPSREYFYDPSSRPRTIFHDRVYHPEDIPNPPAKRRSFLRRVSSYDTRANNNNNNNSDDLGAKSRSSTMSIDSASSSGSFDTNNMKVEEKIARAYHNDLSWRKVLVRLEPDAHNNIIVRRMFSHAYGWPVVKHLVDTHFADSYEAVTADTEAPGVERAKPISEAAGEHGEEIRKNSKSSESTKRPGDFKHTRSMSADCSSPGKGFGEEARDEVSDLHTPPLSQHSQHSGSGKAAPRIMRQDSAQWDDRFFDDEDDEDEDEEFEPPRSLGLFVTSGVGGSGGGGIAAGNHKVQLRDGAGDDDSARDDRVQPTIDTKQPMILDSPLVTSPTKDIAPPTAAAAIAGPAPMTTTGNVGLGQGSGVLRPPGTEKGS